MSSNNSSTVSQKPAATADEPMLTPEQVIEALRALRGRIPDLVQPLSGRELAKLRDSARMEIELVHESVNTVGGAELVGELIGGTPGDLRQAEDESTRWSSVESEIRALLGGVVAANLIRRQRIAKAVRRAYKFSRTLVQQEKYAHLQPHVETMFRVKTRRRTKMPVKPAPPPDPQSKQ